MYNAHQHHSTYFGAGRTASEALDDAADQARLVERTERRSIISVVVHLDVDESDGYDYTATMLVDDSL
jgi:hypothetical protein